MDETAGTGLHDRARLGYAGTLSDLGETGEAKQLYAEIRDSTDHKSEAFQQAQAELDRLNAGG